MLRQKLRLMVLTHPQPTCGQPLTDVVAACLDAGATTIQLRDKEAAARDLLTLAERLLELTRTVGALLIINDRLDVALASGADGVHLGSTDIPIHAARRLAPTGFLIGRSTDDERTARRVVAEGADYLGVGAVYGTRSKPGLAAEAIGPERVRAVLAAAGVPGVGIGGITPHNASQVFAVGAGVAVLSTVMGADDPSAVVRRIAASLPARRHG